jgi:hypothetical protein
MAAQRCLLYLIGFSGLGYALMKLVVQEDMSIYLKVKKNPARGSPSAWGFGMGLRTPHYKKKSL